MHLPKGHLVVKLDSELSPTILYTACHIIVLYTHIIVTRGIEFIPVTLLKRPLYQYHNFLCLRGGHEVVNRVVSTETYQPTCMVKVSN